MKIALIIRKLNVKGGTQRQALSLARELKRMGHKIKIYTMSVSLEGGYDDLLREFEVVCLKDRPKMFHLPELPGFGYLKRLISENASAKTIALLMDRDFDILNPHDQVAYRVAYFYKKRVKNIPSVWNMNDLPNLYWIYNKARGVDKNFYQPFYKRFFYILNDWYDNWKYISAQDAIIVVDFFNRGLVEKYLGRKAITVRSGPDLEHFSYRPPPPLVGKSVRLLTSGIFFPHRRYEDTIRAVRMLLDQGYNPHLSIIGAHETDLKYYEHLKKIVNDLDLNGRVIFMGRVSENDLVLAYSSHNIYIFQHHLQSDGLSQFEAVASGLPIIVSKTAGCHEVLTDGENALFINPKDPQDIVLKIKQLIDDPALYAKLSENGSNFVRNNFSWDKYAKNILTVFKEVLGSK
ncbi:MAG: hypothetical protein COU46_03705 [Candidatus Niyogibacteria bacterium CG10_big_fil_rev_8_21_14_0_10_42_19]|uniref:Glycosyl transferase family 1 domain-containing protein n=1 Tax=Candidatus Niyogibacteria bacterium CG10_big_fil_rev_8_21_14_0_10_42_19 TaxID=1974725 RepID=A0A2H0TEQ1_9BACT|nr:MAG: hypothetical protein COU46_03705 [Candidatus Niyogibacteria bacterium CG10_big_fil_rev_8_21_14_0_10_42_19]